MKQSQMLINEPPLTFQPSLAKALGLDEAIVIQQLHYWLSNQKNEGRIDESGEKWVYNTYAEWQEDNFPFWSEDKIQRVFLSLEKQGVVISAQLDAKKRDMRKFYRIDYDVLCAMDDAILRPSNTANLHDVKMNQRLPETTKDSVLSAKDLEQVNSKVDAIIANSAKATWQGRETFRPDHYPLVDWYNRVTGQECPKSKQKDWHRAVSDWAANNLTVSHLQAAYDMDIVWRGVFTSPNELTNKAVALKAQTKNTNVKREEGKSSGYYA